MEEGDAAFTLKTRLTDQYSDFGLIGVLIARERASAPVPTWEVDTWLMSCRVLGRRVEESMLAELVEAARMATAIRLVGLYTPSSKNSLVADLYEKLGFTRMETLADGTVEYSLNIADYKSPELPFQRD